MCAVSACTVLLAVALVAEHRLQVVCMQRLMITEGQHHAAFLQQNMGAMVLIHVLAGRRMVARTLDRTSC